MPRAYGDPMIVTDSALAQSSFIPAGDKILVGRSPPRAPDPSPIALVPGFEYRMRRTGSDGGSGVQLHVDLWPGSSREWRWPRLGRRR